MKTEAAIFTDEVAEWLDHLAPTDNKRMKVLHELLKHAGEDGMIQADRTICVYCLRKLQRQASFMEARKCSISILHKREEDRIRVADAEADQQTNPYEDWG